MLKTNHADQHFSAYYEDNAILIQLLIVELISTYEILSQIEKVLKKTTPQNIGKYLPDLLHKFKELVGPAGKHDWVGIPSWNSGALTKLKLYSCQFFKNKSLEKNNGIQLYNSVHLKWLIALKNLDFIQKAILKNECNFTKLQRLLNTLLARKQIITNQMLRTLAAFSNNENVIFFLLRKKAALNKIFGPKFLAVDSANKERIIVLTNKYIERGFQHHLPL